MEIRTIEFDISAIVNGTDDARRVRSPGLHVSQIIRDLMNKVVKPGQRQHDSELSPAELQRMGTYRSLGFAWERALERSLIDAFSQGAVIRPGEVMLDGVAGSPDLIDMRNFTLEEWKCTWKSSRRIDNLEDEFWEWTVQIKAYLKMLGFTQCCLRVFFVNGNYRDSGPQVMCRLLIFTQAEIDENWNMLINHARRQKWL